MDHVFIKKRSKKDIWRNLYEFPLIESDALIDLENIYKNAFFQTLTVEAFKILHLSKPIVQNLTHQKIISRFIEIKVETLAFNKPDAFKMVPRKELGKFAFSKNIDWYLKDKSLYLEIA